MSDHTPALDRISGCVLGAAIGDALGHPVEFIDSLEGIRLQYGPRGIEGYVLWWENDTGRFAPYTDDTQMAEVVLRSLLASRDAGEDLDLTMERIGQGFARWAENPQGGHRAPGGACLRGSRELERGRPWREGDPRAGGCGSVMRAYPFGLFFSDERRAETWAVEHSRLTHGHPMALAACAAIAVGVRHAVLGHGSEAILDGMLDAAARRDRETADLCCWALEQARGGQPSAPVLERLQGWNAREAIAAAVHVLARHPDAPRTALLEAANTPGDSDSIATLVGAVVGARCGLGSLPEDWVRDVERSPDLLALSRSIHSASR
jgi:ADP-ribosylglycohydrolase